MPSTQPSNRFYGLEAPAAAAYLYAALASLVPPSAEIPVPHSALAAQGAGVGRETAAVELLSTYARLLNDYSTLRPRSTITTGAALLPAASPVVVSVQVGTTTAEKACHFFTPFGLSNTTSDVWWKLGRRISRIQDVAAFEERVTHNIEGCTSSTVGEVFATIGDYLYSLAMRMGPASLPEASVEHVGRYVLRNYSHALRKEILTFQALAPMSIDHALDSWMPKIDLHVAEPITLLVQISKTATLFIQHQAKKAKEHGTPHEAKPWRDLLTIHNGESVAVFGPATYRQWARMLAQVLHKIHQCTAMMESGLIHARHSQSISRPCLYCFPASPCNHPGCALSCNGPFPQSDFDQSEIAYADAFEQLFPHLEVLWTMAYSLKPSNDSAVETFDIFERLLTEDSIGLGRYLQNTCCFYGSAGRTFVSCYRALPNTITRHPIVVINIDGFVQKRLGVTPTVSLFKDFLLWIRSRVNLTFTQTAILDTALRPTDSSPFTLDIHAETVLRAVRQLPGSIALCTPQCRHYDGRCDLYRQITDDSVAFSGIVVRHPRASQSAVDNL
ncbi:hypothetical protein CALCODRAFT_513554 [Calocera cornea HHB12733]|uniref:Uncharacterized protein n=1 Tax=Calocera cornea HHB12733 TaxID=1353952 RepID=A0A165BZK8_9BASI|nr:hypothetical protein CALCODRAFT_513554 [Calocera cornea HHB12733]